MNRKILFQDWGLTEYTDAFEKQERIFEQIKQIKLYNKRNNATRRTPNYLIFTEHPHVYTLGKSGKPEHLLIDESAMRKKGIRFIKTNRGGDITYHGPGQIVGYPIIDLDNFGIDIIRYIRMLEEVIIRSIAEYGLQGERSEGETGVWLRAGTPQAEKICAIGVKTSRWVTMHGFALNVDTDLSYFQHIIPCGIRDKGVTSLKKELGYTPDKNHLKQLLIRNFAEVFQAEIIFDNKKPDFSVGYSDT